MCSTRRIGLDLFALDPDSSSGVNTFSLGLLQGLQQSLPADYKLVIFCSKYNHVYISKFITRESVDMVVPPTGRLFAQVNRVLDLTSWLFKEPRLRYWHDCTMRNRLARFIDSKCDKLIVPTTLFNFYALTVPTILCIHDIQHEYLPDNFSWRDHILRWSPYRLSALTATKIQVSSLYIKHLIQHKFAFTRNKNFLLAPEGVDNTRFSLGCTSCRPKSLPEKLTLPFIFYPAQIWKHKNHLLLMKALARSRDELGYEVTCVLTGHDYGHWAEVDSMRCSLGLKGVYYLGRVSFNELIWCYENSLAVLALGTHESSCLPVREGSVFGKPLICSDIPPNIEASEDLNLNLFHKHSATSLASLLTKLYSCPSPFLDLASPNKELVSKFYWASIAKLYIP